MFIYRVAHGRESTDQIVGDDETFTYGNKETAAVVIRPQPVNFLYPPSSEQRLNPQARLLARLFQLSKLFLGPANGRFSTATKHEQFLLACQIDGSGIQFGFLLISHC